MENENNNETNKLLENILINQDEKLSNIEKNSETHIVGQSETTDAIKELLPALETIVVNTEPKERPEVQKVQIMGIDVVTLKGDKGEKGDKGDVGDKGEKGDIGEALTFDQLTEEQKKEIKGEKGDNGYTPIKGVDYSDGKDGANGKDGVDGKDGKDGKTGKKGADGSPDTSEQIAEKLNALTKILDFKVIKNFPDFSKNNGGNGIGYIREASDVNLSTAPLNGQALVWDSVGNYWKAGSVVSPNTSPFEDGAGVIKQVNLTSQDFVFGSATLNGTDSRFFFDYGLSAFRAGKTTGTEWDNANVGQYSMAFGLDTIASGYNSISIGEENVSSGDNAVAMGHRNQTTGSSSASLGSSNISSAYSAMTFGSDNTASALNSTAFGSSNTASGINAVAFGWRNTASEHSSTAFGTNMTVNGEFSVGVGIDNTGYTVADDKVFVIMGGKVGIGTVSPSKTLHIVGDVKITGALDPTSVLLSDPASGTALFYESEDGQTAPVSGANTGRLRYNNSLAQWEQSVQGGAYTPLGGSSSKWSLTGNAGTTAGTNFIGTTDAIDFVVKTNATEALRVLSTNQFVGIGTTTPEFHLSLATDGGIIAVGTFGSGASLVTSGAGTRMFWYPQKAAFRAGTTTTTYFDDANIGNYSAGFGLDNKSSGTASFSSGYNNISSGQYSATFGVENQATNSGAFAVGHQVNVYGDTSFGFGYFNTVSGNLSGVFGQNMTVSGTQSYGMSLDGAGYTVANSGVFSIMGGNIGMGTVAPSTTLHLVKGTSGAIRIVDGTQTNGHVLTSDANGVGTWQAASGGFTNPMTTLGDIIYENATPAPARLAGNTTTTKKYLRQTGTGTISAVPSWETVDAIDVTDDTTTNATMYPMWVTASSGNLPPKVSSTKITFNPSTGTLTATVFSGTTTTQAVNDNSTKLASTAYVDRAVSGNLGAATVYLYENFY